MLKLSEFNGHKTGWIVCNVGSLFWVSTPVYQTTNIHGVVIYRTTDPLASVRSIYNTCKPVISRLNRSYAIQLTGDLE